MLNNSICKYHVECSGCSQWLIPRNTQIQQKIEDLNQRLLGFKKSADFKIDFIDLGEKSLRDRVDLIVTNGKLGLYANSSRDIVDIEQCLQFSPKLSDFYASFRKLVRFSIQKGSLRLRVSPSNKTGLWLDFSNQDVKRLLEEKHTLLKCLDIAFVEVGQKRKKLSQIQDSLKLTDPEFHDWGETIFSGKKLPLFHFVGSFTQTGFIASAKFSQIIKNYLSLIVAKSIVEFGSGYGQLTFSLAEENRLVHCFELEPLSVQALEKNISLAQAASIEARIKVHQGNYQSQSPQLSDVETVFVNPPRSGVGIFLNNLLASKNCKNLIYMSCFVESMIKDCEVLKIAGFTLTHATIIDQFPQTPHYEVITLFQR